MIARTARIINERPWMPRFSGINSGLGASLSEHGANSDPEAAQPSLGYGWQAEKPS
ncbi:MAG: hypothetical protein ACK5V5_10115 [Cyclobacteriaceae bacterium]